MIQFTEQGHKYESITPDDIQWVGVTTLIHKFVEPFDQEAKAAKCSVRKPGKYANKWYGYTPQEIIAAWNNESNRAVELGHWYHSKIENELYNSGDVKVIRPVMSNGIKYAPIQKLSDGIYPEHMVYLESVGICGQSDIVEVRDGKVHITDHKTSKEIKRKGFTNWEGITTKMLKPVQHLDDCEFNTYTLQLSIYMYIILRHNPLLVPGDMIINHVKFVQAGVDKFDYPIALIVDGEPVVESIERIEVPYLQKEVQAIIAWLKEPKNKQSLIKH